jgi:hypothetical protein
MRGDALETSALDVGDAAARLVADLMPIAVAVCGPGADAFAAALRQAGAEAEVFAVGGGAACDLTVLLAAAGAPDAGRVGPTIAALATASDRMLFVPAPFGQAGAMAVDAWFELFADHGFQPVVEYDAGYLGAGAFLVDRNVTAADADMAEFAERVSAGAAPPAVTPAAAPTPDQTAHDALQAALAASRAETEAWRARATAAAAEADGLKREIGPWEALGRWVWAACADPARDTLAALRAAAGGPVGKRRLFARKTHPRQAERNLLADAALVRRSRHFDAAWYIASHPELAEHGEDPVWHYVLRGAAAGAEPGPYFDSAPWRARFPDRNPLAEAVRQGEG